MTTKIQIDTLTKEYRDKLCSRQLTRETIDSLAGQISRKYLTRRRAFKWAAILCAVSLLIIAALTFLSPNAPSANLPVLLLSILSTAMMEIFILIFVYFAAVTRVPRQFDRCLRKGYPELSVLYGYETLVNGSLAEKRRSEQLPFSLCIEDTFSLKNSQDLVVAGFAHGLISRGASVYILDKENPSAQRTAALVTAIEKGPGKPAALAADCFAALQIKDGKQLGLRPGMYLYREESSV